MSLLILDVDHFKAVNDTYGHDVGDEVLREVARRITSSLRGIDLSCRFGGEEFVAAFSGVDAAIALQIGERLRRKIAEQPFPIATDKGPLTVTISIGVATIGRRRHRRDAAQARRSGALPRQEGGRNRVVGGPSSRDARRSIASWVRSGRVRDREDPPWRATRPRRPSTTWR